ncbi:MAG: AMP-binding protein [Puniceicoccales bacterium]|jgi:O-succinylbenzoic acid--CoA ligase|nr:AMP-binding protein [Puniceicoccales bacterium]
MDLTNAFPELTAFLAGRTRFCANPNWGATERREAAEEMARIRASEAPPAVPMLHIPSGGSGGRVRFVGHSKETLFAAARAQNVVMFAARKNARSGAGAADEKTVPRSPIFYSTLPAWHISGVMPCVRALVSGGGVKNCDGSFAPDMPLPVLADDLADFRQVSLVPTQLRRLLERAGGGGEEWLRGFDCVLLGGAPADAALLERARAAGIRVALGYGMTETAAFVAWVPPDEFLAGGGVAGGGVAGGAPLPLPPATVLPGAKIEILDVAGAPVPAGISGRVAISAPWLAPACAPRFVTNDEGVMDAGGFLRILGRLDRFIITGGEKVDPRRIEAALLAASSAAGGLVAETLVVGEPDPEWGERVVALLVLKDGADLPDLSPKLAAALRRQLAPHCVPKRWLRVPRLPFDAKGKLDRRALAAALGG